MKSKKETFIIEKMYWERIFLHIRIVTSYRGEVVLYFSDGGGRRTNIEPVDFSHSDDEIAFSVNIASISDRSFLENGRWQLIAETNKGDKYTCAISADEAYKLDDLSRIFKYAEEQMAYNISFGVRTSNEETLELYIDSYFMSENKRWRKRRYVHEVRAVKDKVKRFFMYTSIVFIRIYYHLLYAVIPKRGDRVMIMSETKDVLWGNLKYVVDRLKSRGLDKKYRMTYSYRSSAGRHQGIKDIWSWIKTVTKIAAQDVIFVDDYAPVFGFFRLGKRTKLIQVWHAGEGFKSVGYSRFGKEGSPFPQGSCHKQYTHVITCSEHLIKVFQEVFAIERAAFYPVGMPRLDNFLDDGYIESFKDNFYKEYPELKDKKIILFAPTYRGTDQKEAYYDYSRIDLDRIYNYCSDTGTVFLIKMHPFVKKLMDIPEGYRALIWEFSHYQNINDLYYITDLLITDYSSNYFEYALLRKPVVFYTYDREIYELTRGVHRSIKDNAPGKVCDSFDELISCLEGKDYEYEKLLRFADENFGEYKGNATDRIIDEILLREN